MFDRLIVSEPEGAGARSRKNYFLVSTLAVACLVLTAVVVSIYAEELSLGADSIELSVLVMPVDPPATQPEPPRRQPQPRDARFSSQTLVATRTELIAPITRPERVPTATSVTPNKVPSMPEFERVDIGTTNTDPVGGRDVSSDDGRGTGLSPAPAPVAENTRDVEPPPRAKPVEPHVPAVISGGVVNGKASYLPKPAYPAPAIAVNAQGKVDVQVLIGEDGRVISANALTGNPLLRDAAERAARNARFTPTLLSNVPVKVTGVIVYNFTRG